MAKGIVHHQQIDTFSVKRSIVPLKRARRLGIEGPIVTIPTADNVNKRVSRLDTKGRLPFLKLKKRINESGRYFLMCPYCSTEFGKKKINAAKRHRNICREVNR